jgi:hypothetical protein
MQELYPTLFTDKKNWPSFPLPSDVDVNIPRLGLWASEISKSQDTLCQSKNLRGGSMLRASQNSPRVFFLLDHLEANRNNNLAYSAAFGFARRGWQISILALSSENEATLFFRTITADLVILSNLAMPSTFPPIVAAAISLRQPRALLISGSLAQAMLSFLTEPVKDLLIFTL